MPRMVFSSSEKGYTADLVTKRIVEKLKLKPKKLTKSSSPGKIDETWAVLPLKRLEGRWVINNPADKESAMLMELALQETGRIKHIVDHNEIDKVLDELKLQKLNTATETLAGNIAKILGGG